MRATANRGDALAAELDGATAFLAPIHTRVERRLQQYRRRRPPRRGKKLMRGRDHKCNQRKKKICVILDKVYLKDHKSNIVKFLKFVGLEKNLLHVLCKKIQRFLQVVN